MLANDTDADGDTLTVSGHGSATHGTVACDTTSCTCTPAANYNGSDSFTYTVTDGTYHANGTVDVTVKPVDDAPVLGVHSVKVEAGKSVSFNVLDGARTSTATRSPLPITPNPRTARSCASRRARARTRPTAATAEPTASRTP